MYVGQHEHIEHTLIEAFEVPDDAYNVSVSLDRVSVPMEEPRSRPVGRPAKDAPKRPIDRVFRMAYCGTVTLHDADGEAIHTIRYGTMPDGSRQRARATFSSMTTAYVYTDRARLIRRDEYERMAEVGLFAGERVELLYGVIVRMSPKGAPHESAIERLTELLIRRLAGRAIVRIQSSFAASDGSEPEPDVSVVPLGNYRREHPSRAHWLIEVADSSLSVDRGIKAALHAECSVPEYWIVDVRNDLVEVYTEIVGGAYTRIVPFRRGETIRPLAFPAFEVHVSDIF